MLTQPTARELEALQLRAHGRGCLAGLGGYAERFTGCPVTSEALEPAENIREALFRWGKVLDSDETRIWDEAVRALGALLAAVDRASGSASAAADALVVVRLTVPPEDAAPLEEIEAYVGSALIGAGFRVVRVDAEWIGAAADEPKGQL